MLTELRLYTVGELTHMRSMCVGVVETGVKHCSPAKNHKVTFLLSYFSVTKSTKSQQREHSPLFANSLRVHELVAGSSAWRVRAAKDREEIGSVALPAISTIPRVRTYHTKKPSRFVHALSARPLKVQGGRGSNMRADGTIKISPISLCSHPDPHHYFDPRGLP